MQDILSQIVADKRIEVAEAKAALPLEQLREMALAAPRSTRSMKAALASSSSGIISEFKRKSPSKGWIHEDAQPGDVVPGYAASGASAISILTDYKYFGGKLDFIRQMRPLVDVPILRKDFIIDEYQLFEARLVGADAVLLIAACLSVEECSSLLAKAHELGLEVLLETHSESELAYVSPDVDMLGVNNRNLGTFHTDVANSFKMAKAIYSAPEEGLTAPATARRKMLAYLRKPAGPVLVSESGISNTETVRKLREAGFRGFLMGENFMKESDPAGALRNFIAEL